MGVKRNSPRRSEINHILMSQDIIGRRDMPCLYLQLHEPGCLFSQKNNPHTVEHALGSHSFDAG